MNTKTTIWGSVILLIVTLFVWEFGPGIVGLPEYILPPLSSTNNEMMKMFAESDLLGHFGITALEVFLGFVLGSLLGVIVGVALGLSPTAEGILSPYILTLQIAPKVAFAPLFVMWLGFTIYPKVLVAILIVFFPVMVNVLAAIRTVDPDMVNLVRTLNATRWQIFTMLEFPCALPNLFSGLRIASTLAVIGVTVGELVGGNKGLGFLLVESEGQGNTPGVFVAITGLTLIGIAAYGMVVLLEKRILHYLPKASRTTV